MGVKRTAFGFLAFGAGLAILVIAHYTNAQEKLDIHNRAELIKFALRRGNIK